MKIILIGFMGAGKSSVLHPLAEKLHLKSIELDTILIQQSGRVSVEEIFSKDGELPFRELEIATAKNLVEETNCVIATGGGIIQNKIILDYLRPGGVVIYLSAAFDEIRRRISNLEGRPLFQDEKKAKKLYTLRAPLYDSYSDITISTDGKTIEQITEEIYQKLK